MLTPLIDVFYDEGGEEEAGPTTTVEGDESTEDALETVRNRYARAELTEAEFERKVERLLETETPERTRERVADDEERESARET